MALFRRNRLVFLWAFTLIGLLTIASSTRAQTLRDAVKEHVREGLEKSQEKQKEKKTNRRAAARSSEKKPEQRSTKPSQPSQPVRGQAGSPAVDQQKAEEKEPKLPLRVIGKNLELDLTIGAGYRGWLPQQYPNVSVDMASYFTWNIDVKARIFRWLNLRRGYYESNGLSGPRTEGAVAAAEAGSYVPKAAWLMGMLGFPLFKIWEPIVRYETRAFQTTARPRRAVCVVGKETTGDRSECENTDEMTDKPQRVVSGFETLVAGVRYNASKDSSPVIHSPQGPVPPIFFGIGLMSYTKPYQVTVDGRPLPDYLFVSRFRGIGLAAGTEVGGGVDQFFTDVSLQLGLGEIKLTNKLTLNELAPKGWLIGYVQGDVTIGYRWPLWRFAPTFMLVPAVTGGGAAFFFFKPWLKEGEEATTPGTNWDFLWTARCSLVASF